MDWQQACGNLANVTTSKRAGARFMDETEDHNVQVQPRWPWFAAGGLLFASAAAAAVSVHVLWIPCRRSMLNGTLFATKETKELSDACLRRMDEGLPFQYFPQDVGVSPSVSELGGLAMALAALSWIVLVLGLRLSRGITWIALIAAVAPTVFAIMNMAAALDPDGGLDEYVSGWLWLAVDVVAFAVFLVLGWGHRNHRSGSLLGLGFVLWGATAFGAVHLAMDYSGMLAFNQNNWDIPPGTGWITIAVLLIAAAGSFWFGACRHAFRR